MTMFRAGRKHRHVAQEKISRLKTNIRIREPIGSQEKKRTKQIQKERRDGLDYSRGT
jgi:hypothetical protein